MTTDQRAAGASHPKRKQVFLHIGEPKTGTTFLQHVLWHNRGRLGAQGITYPGSRSVDQWRAAQDILEVVQEPGDPAEPFAGSWDRLVDEALQTGHTAVISHELLAYADESQARRAVTTLADRGADVHIVLTVRDLASLIPAEWQEIIKHRAADPWDEWIDRLAVTVDEAPGRHRNLHFWRAHDTLPILRKWSEPLVPAERVHVITMPPRSVGSDALWLRFAGVVGIDPAHFETGQAHANPSLGVAEAETIRRLNEILPPSFPNWSYQWYVKDTVANGVFAGRPMSARITVPPRLNDFIERESKTLTTSLATSGYNIVGDLAELDARLPQPGAAVSAADVPAELMLDAALAALSGVLQRTESLRVELAEMSARNSRVGGDVKAALIAASERFPFLRWVRVAYWRAANWLRARG